MDKGELGKKIKELREGKGYSLRKFEELAGISTKNIGNIEKGKTDPQISTVKRILTALGYELKITEKTAK